ncbi:MAG: LAGLIDADG family homing endonuclease [Candidatus Nealsonbacteria bacterium]
MLSADYIIGLTDGEGSFTSYIRPPNKRHKAKSYRIECHYYVKLREDDLLLLKKVNQFFYCGRISFQKDNRPNHKNCYRFEITNLKDLKEIIIPFFKKNRLQSKRIKDFNLFCKIVEAVSDKKHFDKLGFRKIQQWKSQMHK